MGWASRAGTIVYLPPPQFFLITPLANVKSPASPFTPSTYNHSPNHHQFSQHCDDSPVRQRFTCTHAAALPILVPGDRSFFKTSLFPEVSFTLLDIGLPTKQLAMNRTTLLERLGYGPFTIIPGNPPRIRWPFVRPRGIIGDRRRFSAGRSERSKRS